MYSLLIWSKQDFPGSINVSACPISETVNRIYCLTCMKNCRLIVLRDCLKCIIYNLVKFLAEDNSKFQNALFDINFFLTFSPDTFLEGGHLAMHASFKLGPGWLQLV